MPQDEWSYVALVVTPNDVTLYLNGVPSTHSTTTTPLDITSMFIGSYQGWGSRNYSGLIDEVRIWNRSLTQEEVRELRHITLTDDMLASETDLLAYYQFNETEGGILDRKGVNHASLVGGAVRSNSDGPFGKGDVDRISITSAGNSIFSNCESNISFGTAPQIPDGEVVLSRLHGLPNELPSTAINYGGYFILNNYGNNANFSVESMILKPVGFSEPPSNWQTTMYVRGENEFQNNWSAACSAANTSTAGLEFGSGCVGQPYQMFPVSDQYVAVQDDEVLDETLVYPNPVVNNGTVMVENRTATVVRFSIYDVEGKLLRSENVDSNQTLQFTPEKASGVYTYSIQGTNYIRNGRLIVVD